MIATTRPSFIAGLNSPFFSLVALLCKRPSFKVQLIDKCYLYSFIQQPCRKLRPRHNDS
jgi:hypothetical protein